MATGLILGIETSCDETAAAVVERGSRTLSSVVASQIALHARYGGVVPELASREHLRAIVPVVRAALAQANVTLADLDAIAVTAGPGLAGALLVGVTYAKALAYAQKLPLVAVNHIEGHIHAVLLHERSCAECCAHGERKCCAHGGRKSFAESCAESCADGERSQPSAQTESSALALVVSGGHTHLFLAEPRGNVWNYKLVGRTLDDAAGEAFDKVSKLLGFPYPGGPWIDALARFGDPAAVPFKFALMKQKPHLVGKTPRTKGARTSPIAELDPHHLFSFSGIKTAVLRYVELHGLRPDAGSRAAAIPAGARPPRSKEEALLLCSQQVLDLVASFQGAVVGDLMKKSFAAAEALGARRILITGGVAANSELRRRFALEAGRLGLRASFPTLALSTDNAAMIAAAAWPRFLSGTFADDSLSADPSLALGR